MSLKPSPPRADTTLALTPPGHQELVHLPLPKHARDESGFSLIELLLVILIIGILAAIAIPAFLNQQAKGYDAAAKTNLQTARTAMEAYSTDHEGKYPDSVDTANASTDPLVSLEPVLKNAPYVTGGSTSSGYSLTAEAVGPHAAADTFTLIISNGIVTRSCSGTGGGCVGSTW